MTSNLLLNNNNENHQPQSQQQDAKGDDHHKMMMENNDESKKVITTKEEESEKSKGTKDTTSDQKRTALSIDHQQVINDLETDKLTPNQALDLAHTLIDNSQFGIARQFIFSILPYIPSSTNNNTTTATAADDVANNQNNFENSNPSRRAYRLIGLSYYNNSELKEALPWFRKAALDSKSVQDWFNLANVAAQVDVKESSLIRLANYAFSQIEELQKVSNFQLKPSFWIQLYYFTIALMNGGHYNEAFTQLNRLKLAYKRARFTDKSYLEEIGLPSFDSFISLSLTLFRRVDRRDQGFEFLKQMEQGVDDAGKQTIERIIREVSSNISSSTL